MSEGILLNKDRVYGGVSFGSDNGFSISRGASFLIRKKSLNVHNKKFTEDKKLPLCEQWFIDLMDQIGRDTDTFFEDINYMPVHCFMVHYELGEWWLTESHFKSKVDGANGVHMVLFKDWIEKENEKFILFDDPSLKPQFAKERLLGIKYGTSDIIFDAIEGSATGGWLRRQMPDWVQKVFDAGISRIWKKVQDRNGLICSELYAKCHSEICKYFNLQTYEVMPLHVFAYSVRSEPKQKCYPVSKTLVEQVGGMELANKVFPATEG